MTDRDKDNRGPQKPHAKPLKTFTTARTRPLPLALYPLTTMAPTNDGISPQSQAHRYSSASSPGMPNPAEIEATKELEGLMEAKSEAAKKRAGTPLESILAAVKVGGRRWMGKLVSRPLQEKNPRLIDRNSFVWLIMCRERDCLEHGIAILLTPADLVARILGQA